MAGQAAIPLNGMDCDPPWTLVTCSVALFGPGVAGWNVTTSGVVSEPPRNVVPGAPTLNEPASLPVIAHGGVSVTLLSGSVFSIVNVVGVDEPGDTVPKSTDGGDTEMPVIAVPSSATVTVPASELVRMSIADLWPVVSGWKVTGIVVVAPPASVVAASVPAAKSAASAPLTLGALRVTDAVSRLRMVIDCDTVAGGTSVPKLMLGGAA